MLAARILYPVEVLGIGKRVGIWVCGCNHYCHACSNPELWEFDKSKDISVDSLYGIIKTICDNNVVDGFTITGGEPFDQADELMELLLKLKNLSADIIVYTGYTILRWEYTKGILKLI
jgi:anaerobic ribonucleoside-triphosphate reductase activating protein